MKIDTTRFGTLDLDESTFIHFPWGIPGFEDLKRYVLLEHRQGPFKWLQAVDHPDVAFVVCPPDVFGLAYSIPPQRLEAIGSPAPDDLAVLVMVIASREQGTIKPHLHGPVLINASARTGCQWILETGEMDRICKAFNTNDKTT